MHESPPEPPPNDELLEHAEEDGAAPAPGAADDEDLRQATRPSELSSLSGEADGGDDAFPRVADEREIADGAPRMLDPKFVKLERISSWISSTVIAIGAAIGVVIAILSVDEWWMTLLGAGVWCIATAMLFWWGYRYPKLFYDQARYQLDETGIEIRRGVWWRQVIDVPRSRVQHTDVTQGPLMRRFGLARLVIHTAGTENASVDLNGLDQPTALVIRDFLIRGGESDGT